MATDLIAKEAKEIDFEQTFEVLVGRPPNQRRFVLHHDLMTARSGFFKTSRSKRWSKNGKPTCLEHVNPEVFRAYLHCVHLNEVMVTLDPQKEGQYQILLDMYILADEMVDFQAANLVIDKIAAIVYGLPQPTSSEAELVYAHTSKGQPLRRLLVDHLTHDRVFTAPELDSYHRELLLDVLEEHMHLKSIYLHMPVSEVFGGHPSWAGPGHYHKHNDIHPVSKCPNINCSPQEHHKL